MDFLFNWGRESISMLLVTVVPAIAAWATLVALRSRDARLGAAVLSATIDIGLAMSLIAIALVGLRPGPGIPGGFEQLNVVPFRDLARAIDGRPWGLSEAVTGVVGNMLLFVPFGLFATLRFPKTPWIAIGLVAVVLATAIEVGQALMGTGRASDTTDIVTNAAGAVVGIAAVRSARNLLGGPSSG